LNNEADFRKSTSAGLEFLSASYGQLASNVSFTRSSSRYYIRTIINASRANNNFPYSTDRGEEKEMANAASNMLGLHSHFAMKIKEQNQLDLFIWYQESDREIPPTTTMAASEAYQVDRALRSSLQWKTYFKKGVLNLKTAWLSEYENYTDPMPGINSLININTIFAESEFKWRLYRHANMDAGISYTSEFADIAAYGEDKQRQGAAVFVNYSQYIPAIKWRFLAGARQEISDNTLAPFTPSVGLEGPVIGILSQKLNLSRNYRLPTLNELYWRPGGNPDIKAEESWNAELSLLFDFFKNTENTGMNFILTGYSSYVDNFILWQPVDMFWAADNIQEVWSRGVESSFSVMQALNNSHLEARISYTYSKSTNEAVNSVSRNKGKQIIYTPLHNAGGFLKFTVKTWQAAVWGNYTGKSYITTDNSEELPGVFLMDMALRKQFILKQFTWQLVFRVNNIFNKDHQLVAYRPMPGRNYQLTLRLTFKN
jgi:iron complex outermembrane receptor protein